MPRPQENKNQFLLFSQEEFSSARKRAPESQQPPAGSAFTRSSSAAAGSVSEKNSGGSMGGAAGRPPCAGAPMPEKHNGRRSFWNRLWNGNELPSERLVGGEARLRDSQYVPAVCLGFAGLLLSYPLALMLRGRAVSPVSRYLYAVMPFQLVAFVGCVIGLLPLFVRDGFGKTLDFFTGGKSIGDHFLACLRQLLLLYPLLLIVNPISAFVCRLMKVKTVPQAFSEVLGTGPSAGVILILVITSVLTAPFVEELLFRVVLFRSVRSLTPRWASLVTAVVFAVLHGSPQFYPGLFLVAMTLQNAWRHGGFLRCFLLHCCYNAVTVILFFLMPESVK